MIHLLHVLAVFHLESTVYELLKQQSMSYKMHKICNPKKAGYFAQLVFQIVDICILNTAEHVLLAISLQSATIY